ncbi:MAG: S-layer homology domain-containing protein [Candidatus Galacturonibacter soehngenii]|nr:S-layer homology domain-containing protein [Candidatus Galacturonibacter soehngenii]
MFQKTFQFTDNPINEAITISSNTLFSFEQGYGFLTEENCFENELLQIPELNNGFEPWYWYQGHKLIHINQDKYGCFLTHSEMLPLSFKANVPSSGNYKLRIHITAGKEPVNHLMVYTGRRHLALFHKSLHPFESYTFETVVNVCDFIPRGREIPYTDQSICVTLVSDAARITTLHIEEVKIPTIYIAGDSTLTDQTGTYPYIPENCYCGWGQFLSFFLNQKASISNHAHSGLTTESFRSEGHYSIIEKNIKEGDFFLLQFGHNDQKLSHLTAFGGYRNNVVAYIREIRKKRAIPVLVTPLCRNSWKGVDGSYHDLLEDYNQVIHQIGQDEKVAVIDLHQKSYDFITGIGLEDAKRYFFPGDFTHTNDYGGYKMASFVAEDFHTISKLSGFVTEHKPDWIPPATIEAAKPPKGFEHLKNSPVSSFKVEFTDIEELDNKDKIIELTASGIIPNSEKTYRPMDMITRAEALFMVIKIANFFPTNVYNDMFQDIVGHEWYAGCVECAWSNGIVDQVLVDKNFYPQKEVTYEELISFIVNGYKCRKSLPNITPLVFYNCSKWATSYYNAAHAIGLLNTAIKSNQLLTRQTSADILYAFKNMM